MSERVSKSKVLMGEDEASKVVKKPAPTPIVMCWCGCGYQWPQIPANSLHKPSLSAAVVAAAAARAAPQQQLQPTQLPKCMPFRAAMAAAAAASTAAAAGDASSQSPSQGRTPAAKDESKQPHGRQRTDAAKEIVKAKMKHQKKKHHFLFGGVGKTTPITMTPIVKCSCVCGT